MRSEPSRPVTRLPRACRDGSRGAITGKWACAASRRVRSCACRARAVTVPEPHDGAPKGALTVCLLPTRGSLEQKVGLSPRVRLGAAQRPSPRLGLPLCARGLLS